jgi:hypothetical protein
MEQEQIQIEEGSEWECKCGEEGTDFHTCPFQKEIYDDDWSMCNCCSECEENCLMDI